jgi:hypothetical protein
MSPPFTVIRVIELSGIETSFQPDFIFYEKILPGIGRTMLRGGVREAYQRVSIGSDERSSVCLPLGRSRELAFDRAGWSS